jgi:fucose 4-O-acetylase-like acetyltransferase
MSEAPSGRKAYMDVLKALGVLAIVLAHSWPPSVVGQVVSTYYIALFFFVSGYFYSDKYSDDLWLLARKRLWSLYKPFVLWNLGYLVLHNLLFRLNLYSAHAGYMGAVGSTYGLESTLGTALGILTLTATEQLAGALWFLIALISCTAVFGLLSWVSRRMGGHLAEYARLVLVVVVFTLGYLSQSVLKWPAFINTSLVGVLIFYGGFQFRRIEPRVPINALLAVAAASIVFVGRGTVVMGANQYKGPLILVVVVAAGVYANLFMAKRLETNLFLSYLGQHTVFVVATHFLAFKVVSFVYILVYDQPMYMLASFPVITGEDGWWIAYFTAGVLLPMLCHVGLDRLGTTLRPAIDAGFDTRETQAEAPI